MSDTQQGPEWWQASDGKWYPPPQPDWPPAPGEATAPPAPTDDAPPPPAAPSGDSEPALPDGPPVTSNPTTPVPSTSDTPGDLPPAPPPAAPPAAPLDAAAPPPPPDSAPTEVLGVAPGPGSFGGDDADTSFLGEGPIGTGPSRSGDPFGTPERNKTPIVLGILLVVVIAAVAAFFLLGGDDDDEGGDADVAAEVDDEQDADVDEGPDGKVGDPPDDAPEVTPAPGPSSGDDAIEFVEPGDAEPIDVVESGFIVQPDSFGGETIDAGFGVVIRNSNDDLAATTVEVELSFLDANGDVVESRSEFVNGLLPNQTVGFGRVINDVPEGIVDLDVRVEPSQFVRIDELDGELTVSDVSVDDDEFSGLTVNFAVTSSFAETQENVTTYALVRDSSGRPVAGGVSFIDSIGAGETALDSISTFLSLTDVGAVEAFATVEPSIFFD